MQNVLVTGATGFVGKNVVRLFCEEDYNVTATDIKGADFSRLPDVKCVESDITNKESLEKVVKNQDIIINVAGLVDLNTHPKLLNAVNHLGVKNVCEVAKNSKVKKIIQVSSMGVYGNNKKVPLDEDDEKNPKNNYEISKWKGEQEAFSYLNHLEVIAVRPSTVYGFGSLHNAILPLFAMKKKKKLYSLKGGPLLSHIHVEDVARAIVFLAEHPDAIGEAYNLADDRPLNSFEMTSALLQPLGIEVKEKIPFMKNSFRALKYVAQKMPKKVYQLYNQKLEQKWGKFAEENELKQRFRAQVDPIWLDYVTTDKVISNEKLKSLGFEFKHPDPRIGLKAMVEEYINRNHLPKKINNP